MGLRIFVEEVASKWNLKGKLWFIQDFPALQRKFKSQVFLKRRDIWSDTITPFKARGLKEKEWFSLETDEDDCIIFEHYKNGNRIKIHSSEFKQVKIKHPAIKTIQLSFMSHNTNRAWFNLYDYLSDNLYFHVWNRFRILISRSDVEWFIKWFAIDKEKARELILDKMNDKTTFAWVCW